jgi:integrase
MPPEGVNLRAKEAAKKAKRNQAAAGEALTLGRLLGDWAATDSTRRASYTKTTVADLERAFEDLLERPIDPAVDGKVEERIEECLEALADRPAARRVAAQKIRTLCRWATKKRKLSADPTEKIDLGEKSKNRKVFLTGDEARLVWQTAGTMPAPYGQLIKLLQASGVRLREAAGALRREFSSDFSEWSIPGERMKEGEPHVVWLPPVVGQMLRELPRFADSDLIFTRDGKHPVSGFTHLKRQIDKALGESADKMLGESIAKKFVFHDLRRTITTWLVRNGVDSFVADRLLAHTQLTKISAVASTYNIYDFEPERRAALERWVDFLEGGEAAATPSPSPQLALSVPEPAPLDGTVLRPVSAALAVLEDYEEMPPSGTVVTRYLPARPEQRDEQLERLQRRVINILADPRVMRANLEILKETPTPQFKAEHPSDPNTEAIKLMAHCVARWAIDGETVRKPSEIKVERDYWEERARDAENDAKTAWLAAKRADELHQPEYAEGHSADAKRFEDETALSRQFLQNAMSMDDPQCVKYRSGDPLHQINQAKALLLLLKPITAEIFGRPKSTWAKAYADAAAGEVAAKRQRRRRQDSGRVS